jgi:hypothetical protein
MNLYNPRLRHFDDVRSISRIPAICAQPGSGGIFDYDETTPKFVWQLEPHMRFTPDALREPQYATDDDQRPSHKPKRQHQPDTGADEATNRDAKDRNHKVAV